LIVIGGVANVVSNFIYPILVNVEGDSTPRFIFPSERFMGEALYAIAVYIMGLEPGFREADNVKVEIGGVEGGNKGVKVLGGTSNIEMKER
jgi:hypothetical protein